MGQSEPQNFIASHFECLKNYCSTKEPYLYEHQSQKTFARLRTFSIQANKVLPHCHYFQIRKQLNECEQLVKVHDYQIINVATQSESIQTFCQANCSEEKRLVILREEVGVKLQEQILNRRNKQAFEEIQLWSVISSSVMGALAMIQFGLKQPILSPQAITLTKDGMIKVGEWQAISQQKQYKISTIVSNYYWAPQGFSALETAIKVGQLQHEAEQTKGQIFSLGMTIISMCLRELLYQTQTFSQKQLSLFLEQAYKRREQEGKPLSKKLKELMQEMIRWNHCQRISYQQLRVHILTYFQSNQELGDSSIKPHSLSQSSIDFFSSTDEKPNAFIESFEGSGLISQGMGDDYEPEDDYEKKGIAPLEKDQEDRVCNMVEGYEEDEENADIFESDNQSEEGVQKPLNDITGNFTISNVLQKKNINIQDEKHIFTDPKLLQFLNIRFSPNQSMSENSRHQIHSKSISPAEQEKNSSFQNEMSFSEIKQISLSNINETEHKRVVKEQFSKGYYEGQKHNSMRNGYGIFYYHQGGKYRGNWLNNKMHGKGVLQYGDGRIAYEGDWANDELNGKGILYNEAPIKVYEPLSYDDFNKFDQCWLYYDGEFRQDDKEGMGLLVLSNGEEYMGNFCGDMANGYGEYRRKDGTVVRGEWKNNKLAKLLF